MKTEKVAFWIYTGIITTVRAPVRAKKLNWRILNINWLLAIRLLLLLPLLPRGWLVHDHLKEFGKNWEFGGFLKITSPIPVTALPMM